MNQQPYKNQTIKSSISPQQGYRFQPQKVDNNLPFTQDTKLQTPLEPYGNNQQFQKVGVTQKKVINYPHEQPQSQPQISMQKQQLEQNQQKYYQDYQQKQQLIMKQRIDINQQNIEQQNISIPQLAEYKKIIERQQEKIRQLKSQVQSLEDENKKLKEENLKKQQLDYQEMKSMIVALKIQEREQKEAEKMQYIEFMNEAYTPQHQSDPTVMNTDQMTYEQLLELQDQIGYVNRGYNEDQIKQIIERQIKLSNKIQLPEQCSICFSQFQVGEKYRQLKCSHQYHSDCIRQWLLNEKKCPICKEEALS